MKNMLFVFNPRSGREQIKSRGMRRRLCGGWETGCT